MSPNSTWGQWSTTPTRCASSSPATTGKSCPSGTNPITGTLAAATLVVAAAAPHAYAATTGISGSTAWGPCTWSVSNNVRYTSVANKQVRVKLSTTGKLRVKMKSRNVNTGADSAVRYYPRPVAEPGEVLGKGHSVQAGLQLRQRTQARREPVDGLQWLSRLLRDAACEPPFTVEGCRVRPGSPRSMRRDRCMFTGPRWWIQTAEPRRSDCGVPGGNSGA